MYMVWPMETTDKWKWIKTSSWMILFMVFANQTWKEWNRFKKSPKTTTIEYKEVTSFDLPDIFLCDRSGFKASVTKHFGENEYHPNVNLVDASIDLFLLNHTKYRVIDLPTSYNGLCKLFKFDFRLEPMTWIALRANDTGTYDLFLNRKDLELHFVNQDQMFAPLWFKMDSTMCLELEMTTYHEDTDLSTCADVTTKAHGQCILNVLSETLMKHQLECVPIVFAELLTNLTIPICQESKQAIKTLDEISLSLNDILRNLNSRGCKRPCHDTAFKGKPIYASPNGMMGKDGYFSAYIYYAHNMAETRTIYSLVDFPTFLSSMGGFLGLFLGASAYSIIQDIMQISVLTWKRIKCWK
ncbi:uncharacterized protein LOC131889951 [Tigriopus californicus]|uniref:uncharacterized protein LOC131889951 n=1 Tax=Tigriopus californicus TaxID=6832 RepID=UPI0027DAAE2C|nr:uncharacterized protein LOC131889951 [Tigriopus californicus]XP_059095168.1 uncharacterized protein LOC131889951 [Tigriopus californicus]